MSSEWQGAPDMGKGSTVLAKEAAIPGKVWLGWYAWQFQWNQNWFSGRRGNIAGIFVVGAYCFRDKCKYGRT